MIKDVLSNVDVFENKIEDYLNEFCDNNNIDDMKAEPQSVWNAALMYIQKNVFKNRDFLKTSKPHPNYINNEYENQYSNLNHLLLKLVQQVLTLHFLLQDKY